MFHDADINKDGVL